MPARTTRYLAVLLLVALAVRLGTAAWWQHRLGGPREFFFADSQSYWVLGRAIAQGGPYEFGSEDARVFRAPGYPLLLAPIFLAFGPAPPAMSGRALGAACGALAVALVWWLARRLFGARAGWIAGWTAALYPEAVVASILVLSEAPFCPLLLAQLALATLAWQARPRHKCLALAAAAGVAAGMAALVRPSWLLFTPALAVAAVAVGRERMRQLTVGAAMTAGLAAAMAPWWVRNYQATGRFVPTTLQVGASLYDGLNPRATGASDMGFVPEFAASERWLETYRGPADDAPWEYRLDRAMRDEALAWAARNPRRAAVLAVKKLSRTWNLWPNEPALSAWPVRLAVGATYLPVLALGLAGAARSAGRGWPYGICWLPAAYFTLLHAVFVSSIRYRLPPVLALTVLAAGAAAGWTGRTGVAGTDDEVRDR